jgi:hypothetical protein
MQLDLTIQSYSKIEIKGLLLIPLKPNYFLFYMFSNFIFFDENCVQKIFQLIFFAAKIKMKNVREQL